jgi:hypothetical protein
VKQRTGERFDRPAPSGFADSLVSGFEIDGPDVIAEGADKVDDLLVIGVHLIAFHGLQIGKSGYQSEVVGALRPNDISSELIGLYFLDGIGKGVQTIFEILDGRLVDIGFELEKNDMVEHFILLGNNG